MLLIKLTEWEFNSTEDWRSYLMTEVGMKEHASSSTTCPFSLTRKEQGHEKWHWEQEKKPNMGWNSSDLGCT